jgi:hypothetical protein
MMIEDLHGPVTKPAHGKVWCACIGVKKKRYITIMREYLMMIEDLYGPVTKPALGKVWCACIGVQLGFRV